MQVLAVGTRVQRGLGGGHGGAVRRVCADEAAAERSGALPLVGDGIWEALAATHWRRCRPRARNVRVRGSSHRIFHQLGGGG